jgi:hypothetical protein
LSKNVEDIYAISYTALAALCWLMVGELKRKAKQVSNACADSIIGASLGGGMMAGLGAEVRTMSRSENEGDRKHDVVQFNLCLKLIYY